MLPEIQTGQHISQLTTIQRVNIKQPSTFCRRGIKSVACCIRHYIGCLKISFFHLLLSTANMIILAFSNPRYNAAKGLRSAESFNLRRSNMDSCETAWQKPASFWHAVSQLSHMAVSMLQPTVILSLCYGLENAKIIVLATLSRNRQQREKWINFQIMSANSCTKQATTKLQ